MATSPSECLDWLSLCAPEGLNIQPIVFSLSKATACAAAAQSPELAQFANDAAITSSPISPRLNAILSQRVEQRTGRTNSFNLGSTLSSPTQPRSTQAVHQICPHKQPNQPVQAARRMPSTWTVQPVRSNRKRIVVTLDQCALYNGKPGRNGFANEDSNSHL